MNKSKQLRWRRSMVLKLSSQGYREADIAERMQISQPSVSRDLNWLRKQSEKNMQNFIQQQIPLEVDKAFFMLDWIMRECAVNYDKTEDKKLKLQILSLMKDVEHSKMDLLSDTTIAKEIVRTWKDKQEKLSSRVLSSANIAQTEEEEEEEEVIDDKE